MMPAARSSLLTAERFDEITAAPPDFEALRPKYRALGEELSAASSVDQALRAFAGWEQLRRPFSTWAALTELHFNQDTASAEHKAAVDALNELRPKVTGLDVEIKRAFLRSSLRADLERELGRYVFDQWETDVTAYDPAIEPFAVRESKLEDEYTELLASAAFEFAGEKLNLSTIGKFAEHPDRQTRRAAAIAKWEFFAQNAQRLDGIYDRLVRLRDEMARELGFANFVDLGYRRMKRTDYAPSDVSRYRDEIVREIVPVAERIVEIQARDAGIDELHIWDEQIFDRAGAPRPPQEFAEMLRAALGAFSQTHPEIGAFAGLMIERNLIDLQSRDGKAGGGFCTSFPTYGLPFIFSNFNGTTHDVNVLLHEMGHAFQAYASRSKPVSEYLWPTYEACEIHSMSMEFLAWPQLERFFGADAERYRLQHLKSSLLFLPYGAAIDHFQHFAYENPSASPDERNAFWLELEARYLPWRKNGGIAHLERGGFWQHQRHVYLLPFYYIDYTLALCCALQFWARSLDDHDRAVADYIALCKRGGELPFQALARSAGLQSPFDDGVLRAVAQRALAILG